MTIYPIETFHRAIADSQWRYPCSIPTGKYEGKMWRANKWGNGILHGTDQTRNSATYQSNGEKY